ncbi:MAG: hypothetical protein Q9216_001055 [Gyalolechia sp. 2 TL-2023]
MPVLLGRSEFTDNASAKASSGWNTCMSKAYCKYPAIIGIVLGILIALACLYCLFRFLSCCCCDCLSGGRYQRSSRKRKHRYADLGASPYTGYQAAANPGGVVGTGPGYREPPQYARFEYSNGGADSLPKMPVWEEAGKRRVEDEGVGYAGGGGGDGKREKELEVEYEMREPMLRGERESAPAPAYAEMDAGSPAGGDLGYGRGYKPYGAGYTAYSPVGKGST